VRKGNTGARSLDGGSEPTRDRICDDFFHRGYVMRSDLIVSRTLPSQTRLGPSALYITTDQRSCGHAVAGKIHYQWPSPRAH
jgi:hypothetical protein